jgi:hypothetical protein
VSLIGKLIDRQRHRRLLVQRGRRHRPAGHAGQRQPGRHPAARRHVLEGTTLRATVPPPPASWWSTSAWSAQRHRRSRRRVVRLLAAPTSTSRHPARQVSPTVIQTFNPSQCRPVTSAPPSSWPGRPTASTAAAHGRHQMIATTQAPGLTDNNSGVFVGTAHRSTRHGRRPPWLGRASAIRPPRRPSLTPATAGFLGADAGTPRAANACISALAACGMAARRAARRAAWSSGGHATPST